MFRLAAAVLLAVVIVVGTAGPARAETVACGEIHVPSYAPIVTECGSWGIQRYPERPVFRDGRWVFNDDGLEFTLMSNVGQEHSDPKDAAMLFHGSSGAQIRFGVAQPLDGSEPSQKYLEEHIGLYVESEYVGDWRQFRLPIGD